MLKASFRYDFQVALSDKEIIQVDATVIAGILILLTVSSIFPLPENINRFFLTFMTASIVIPFAVSAISITGIFFAEGLRFRRPPHILRIIGNIGTVVGFGYLIIAMIILTSGTYAALYSSTSSNSTNVSQGSLITPSVNATININEEDIETDSGFSIPLIIILQFVISGAAAGVALYFANRLLDRYRRPVLNIDKENSPVPRLIDIEVFRTEFQSIIHESRIPYIVNRIIVKNLGRTAAEGCKGSIVMDGEEEKVCWSIPHERYIITINANDREYLDVCAVLSEHERDRSTWLKEIRDRASMIPDIEGYIDKIDYVPTLESFRIRRETLRVYKSADDIPLIIAPTEEGWLSPPHQNRKMKPGNAQLKITAKNASPIITTIRILERPDGRGRIIEFI